VKDYFVQTRTGKRFPQNIELVKDAKKTRNGNKYSRQMVKYDDW
jgi:hypothetical protein